MFNVPAPGWDLSVDINDNFVDVNENYLKSREGSSGLPARKYFYRPLSGRTVSIWVAKPDRRRIFNVPAYGGTCREDMPLIYILYSRYYFFNPAIFPGILSATYSLA